MDMGFGRDEVVECLEINSYNKEMAVQFLLNEMNHDTHMEQTVNQSN